MRRVLGWLTCWDRPWNARTAMLESLIGHVYCPCPKHEGKRLPARVAHLQHLVDKNPEAFR